MKPLPSAPPKLAAAYSCLAPPARDAFYEHLIGGTSAAYLSDWLTRYGYPVGATTIKSYRSALRQIGVCK